MKQLLLTLITFISLSAIMSSCKKIIGSGPTISSYRDHKNFDEIDLSIDAKVNIIQDSVYGVEIVAQQNILDVVVTKLEGSTLCIGLKPKVIVKGGDILLNIHLPKVNSIHISGSGELSTVSNFTSNQLKLNISGSGKISMQAIKVTNLICDISGSGNIFVSQGEAHSLSTNISGSGEIDLLNLITNFANTKTSGSGTTKVQVVEQLDAKISGSGNVYYKGTPIVNANISGSGKLIHLK